MVMFSKARLAKKAPVTKETVTDSDSDNAVEVLEPSVVTSATPKRRLLSMQ